MDSIIQKSMGYLGTELLQKTDPPLCFLTIDRWESKQAYEIFLTHWKEEYKTLDAQCEGLTKQESMLGMWNFY
jgi:heme-degrading monooxygenase HmoA